MRHIVQIAESHIRIWKFQKVLNTVAAKSNRKVWPDNQSAINIYIDTPAPSARFMIWKVKVIISPVIADAMKRKILARCKSIFPAFPILCDNNSLFCFRGVKRNIPAAMMLFSRPMIGRLSDRFGMLKTFIPALFCYAASFVVISIAHTLPVFLLAAVISAFGYGTCAPAGQTLCMKCVSPDRRGTASSTSYIGEDIGNILGPILSGTLVTSFGYHSMWLMMIIPVGIVAALTIIFSRKISEIEHNFLARSKSDA